jgi:hypothetical protein
MKKLFIYTAFFLFSCQSHPSNTETTPVQPSSDTGNKSTPGGTVTTDPANSNPGSGSGTENNPGLKKDNPPGSGSGTDENKPPNTPEPYPGSKGNLSDSAMESNTSKGAGIINGTKQNTVNNVKTIYTDQKGKLSDTAQEIKMKVIKKH